MDPDAPDTGIRIAARIIPPVLGYLQFHPGAYEERAKPIPYKGESNYKRSSSKSPDQ